MTRAPDLLWQRVPALVGRVWPTLGYSLADGAYLRRWPGLGLAAPAGGLVLGMLLGALHPGTLYTYSFLVTAAMMLAAGLGAGVGVWVWLGFVLVDVVATDRSSLPGFGLTSAVDRFTDGYLPLAMCYLLLAVLLMLGPLLGSGFASRTAVTVRPANDALALPSACVVYVVVVSALAYAWAQATPFMIRPLWSFAGGIPDTAAVQPIQSHALALAAIAGLAAAGRCVLIALTGPGPAWPNIAPPGSARDRGAASVLPAVVLVPFQALFLTLLLGGLVENIVLGA